MPNLKSTKSHRNAQRTNGVAEVAVSALKVISPIAILPGKLAQSLNSGYAFFHTPKCHEKSIHVFQGLLALSQIVLASVLLFKGQECKTNDESVCKASLILELLYQGSLMAAWVPSELSKENLSPASSENSLSPSAHSNLLNP